MGLYAGQSIDSIDLALPAWVSATGAGNNTVTALTFTNLPTVPCAVAITNPHPTAKMTVNVYYGAWASSSSAGARVGVNITGATIITPVALSAGWGEIIRVQTDYHQYFCSSTCDINPGSNTFTVQAYRESSGSTVQVNYATVRVVPVRYVFP